jgi:hypothetical protein
MLTRTLDPPVNGCVQPPMLWPERGNPVAFDNSSYHIEQPPNTSRPYGPPLPAGRGREAYQEKESLQCLPPNK